MFQADRNFPNELSDAERAANRKEQDLRTGDDEY